MTGSDIALLRLALEIGGGAAAILVIVFIFVSSLTTRGHFSLAFRIGKPRDDE